MSICLFLIQSFYNIPVILYIKYINLYYSFFFYIIKVQKTRRFYYRQEIYKHETIQK